MQNNQFVSAAMFSLKARWTSHINLTLLAHCVILVLTPWEKLSLWRHVFLTLVVHLDEHHASRSGLKTPAQTQ